MPEEKKPKAKPPTPFELALAAKQNRIKPEQLRGAAKLLFKQFNEDQLKAYVHEPAQPQPKVFGRQSMRRGARSF